MATTTTSKATTLLRVLVVCLALLASQLGAGPAQAGDHPVNANWKGGCSVDGGGGIDLTYTPYGQVYMRENGRSGVIRFQARFRLYVTDTGAGWNPPRLERTVLSPSFPNDQRNFQDYLPRGAYHRWTGVYATHSYRLNAKLTYERGRWRRDWNYSVDITTYG
ncbi:MAG: hypothetical protein ACR2MB_08470 [Acidimicrobiales bacterium]